MRDSDIGKSDGRGSWAPSKPVTYGPLFGTPWSFKAVLKWIFGYPGFLVPWTIPYALLAWGIWTWATPDIETMTSFAPGWVLFILARNLVLAVLVYGAWHLWLYSWKKQGTNFKYNKQWPKDQSPIFAFGNQLYDNMFYTLASGVPIWTAYECLMLWAFANGHASMISFASNPVWFVALFLVIPFIHEVSFYFAHRLVHFPLLYKWAHHVHHRNVSPGPWSGMSMHPLEHFFYLMPIAIFFLIPGHPIHMINLASRLGLAPAQGHTGFDQIDLGNEKTFSLSYYAHHLHHKYFEVNYSDGMVPLDKWFGSFHDGTPEAHEAMKARRARLGDKLAKNG